MEDRFWRQVNKDTTNGCWLWTGPDVGKNKKLGKPSYGQLYWKGSRIYAHKLSYILHFGDVEAGYEIDHNCLNPKCVNPAHLEKVTRLENTQRMHLYRNLTKEIDRLRSLIISLGGDPDADVLTRSRLSEVGKVVRPF
jgi:hypothetical protein